MSSGLLYLTPKDFVILQNDQGHHLTNRIKGISMVMYYSRTCVFCETLIPIFKTLPGRVQGVHFAMANVSADEKRLEKMAGATKTPIKYVPYIVFYVNGEYFMEYRGAKTADGMARAAFEVSTKATSGQDFTTGRACTSKTTGLAGYCTGDDNWEDETCMTYGEVCGQGSKQSKAQPTCMTYGEICGVGQSQPPQPSPQMPGYIGPQQMMPVAPGTSMGVQPQFQRRQ
jgi:thiol-disulfide isomerase/thioredoxin